MGRRAAGEAGRGQEETFQMEGDTYPTEGAAAPRPPGPCHACRHPQPVTPVVRGPMPPCCASGPGKQGSNIPACPLASVGVAVTRVGATGACMLPPHRDKSGRGSPRPSQLCATGLLQAHVRHTLRASSQAAAQSSPSSLGRWGAPSPVSPLRRGGWGWEGPPIAQTRFVCVCVCVCV